MKPVLVLQQTPTETLGALESHFRGAGLPWRCLEMFRQAPQRIDLGEAAGLVVLGGPMNVDEVAKYPFLETEIVSIRQAIESGLPLLGVCLGAQLLAKSLGARVYANPVKEIGWYQIELTAEAVQDPLFAGCAPRQTVFQWHGDTFDLPTGAVHLAQAELCRRQAFRYGPCAWGLQFHVEMTAELVDAWLDDPENRRELSALRSGREIAWGLSQFSGHRRAAMVGENGTVPLENAAEAIRAQTPELLPRMESLGSRVLSRFTALCRAG